MATMNMIQAVRSGLDVMLGRDDTVCAFGEDVGYFGGVFRATTGLQEKHGKHRVFDTPLTEGGIVATAIGMGINGLRPVPEIQFADYIYPAFDQITNELAKLRYRSGGQWSAPVTIRTPCGGGIRGGMYHSQSPEAYFTHTAGLTVVMPSNPVDAKGLLISSIESNDPVLFLEPKRLYRGPFDGDPNRVPRWNGHLGAEVPEDYYKTPLEKAVLVREGSAVTVITWGTMVHVARAAIDASEIDAELIDLRTLVPMDLETVAASVTKTGRCVVVHEAARTSGFGAEVVALVQEECFWSLESPILRVTGWDSPVPHTLELDYLPSRKRIAKALGGYRFLIALLPDESDAMDEYIFKLPDLGEGVVEGEIVSWHVQQGDVVQEDAPLVDVMTDKATVTISSVVSGQVTSVHGCVGQSVAVGSELIKFDVTVFEAVPSEEPVGAVSVAATSGSSRASSVAPPLGGLPPALPVTSEPRPLASPAVRRRAREKGVDLAHLTGTGRGGRVTDADIENHLLDGGSSTASHGRVKRTGTTEIHMAGLADASPRK